MKTPPSRSALAPHRGPASRQRGAALLMALIIVTLVTTLATSMVWQQWRAVQVEAAERSRSQSSWILAGALDWARIILRADVNQPTMGRRTSTQIDHLGEPWAVPLAEARLSTFLAVDESHADDAPDTFLSGRIEDAQARYNLRNLVSEDAKKPGLMIPNPDQQKVLEDLCGHVSVSASVAAQITKGLSDAWSVRNEPIPGADAGTGKDVPLQPTRFEDLAWLGVDAESLKRLEPFVWISPPVGKNQLIPQVNLNTASREVLAAVIGIDTGAAERLVQARNNLQFETLDDTKKVLGENVSLKGRLAFGNSDHFIISGRVRLAGRILDQRSLVKRSPANTSPVSVTPLSRESFNSADPG
jgi:general secretion pathway protein K